MKSNLFILKALIGGAFVYVGYCAYAYYDVRKKVAPQNNNHLIRKANQCQSATELASIFKVMDQHFRKNVIDPKTDHSQVVDCEVKPQEIQDEAISNYFWWMMPYVMKNQTALNHYNSVLQTKTGVFSILFWTQLLSQQRLLLTNFDSDANIAQQLLDTREQHCWRIANVMKENQITSAEAIEEQFIACFKKVEGVARMLERDLQLIRFISEETS